MKRFLLLSLDSHIRHHFSTLKCQFVQFFLIFFDRQFQSSLQNNYYLTSYIITINLLFKWSVIHYSFGIVNDDAYQVFARRCRPRTFDDVLGQDHVIHTLKNAIEQKRLAHAYLFVGPRGTGKTTTARIFAKALNCSNGPSTQFDPDEPICKEIEDGTSFDVLEIDGASNRGIDSIRELRENVRFAPSKGKFRIVYIDEVHMLTKESFNALLKTLEEPPPHVKFIFATTEPHKILPTILSRCQRFDLRPIPADTIATHLLNIATNDGVELSKEAAYAVAKAADGGMRDALSMLDQLVSFCGKKIGEEQVLQIFGITSRETVAQALTNILSKNLPGLLKLIHEQAEAGRDMGQLLSEIISSVREILVSKVAPSTTLDSIPETSRESLTQLVNKTQTDKILRLVDILAETEDKMRWSSNKRLHLEMGLIKAVHSLAEASISDIIMALDGATLPERTPIRPIEAPVATEAPVAEAITTKTEPLPENTPPVIVPPPPAETAPVHNEHLMDPVPTFTPASTQQQEKTDTTPPAIEPEELTQAPSESSISEESSTPTADGQIPTIGEEPTPTPPSEEAQPQKQIISALSDAPVAPPEPEDEIFEENTPVEDTQTGNFFDMFGMEATPATSSTKEQTKLSQQGGRILTHDDWIEALQQAEQKNTMKVQFIKHGVFSSHEGNTVTIGFHPIDKTGINTLMTDSFRRELESYLSEKAQCTISLKAQSDLSIPEPITEEIYPEPEPLTPEQPPAQVAAPAPEKKPEPVDETPKEEVKKEEEYYNDPLIDEALQIFRARIIPQK